MKMPFSVSPCLRGKAVAGFTLVEVLAALAVLTLGMSVVVAMFYGNFREGQKTSDRNAAAILIPEAVRAIEQQHRISQSTATTYGLPAAIVGQYIETLQNSPESDDLTCQNVAVNGKPIKGPADVINLNEYPLRAHPPATIGGSSYRVRYRLEKHPDWWPHDNDGVGLDNPANENVDSSFRGIYVLTLICFRDSEKNMSRPIPACDPVVVYLKDGKLR